MIMMASSTHPDPGVAAECTLLKLARNRALQIFTTEIGIHSGRSEMVEKAGYERYKRINRMWFADAPEISTEEIPAAHYAATDEELHAAIAAVAPHTDRICIADLTRTPLPVWRVVIPGFEVSLKDDDRGHRSLVSIEAGFEDHPLGRDGGIALDFRDFGNQQDHLQKFVQVGFLFR